MSVALSLNALPHTPTSSADSASPSIPPPTPLSPTGSGFADSGPHDSSRPNTANTSNSNSNNTNGNDAPTGNVKRKASRRANTAERRATHNAVERQRRETLNGRFLDLAALLPNLATVRRPSKSAIVNSSIALIHSQRRARAAAGRELRNIEAESDALRREVNEWRARSGAALPALQAPARTPEFAALVSTEDLGAQAEEEERRAYALVGQEQEGEGEDYEEGEEAFPRGSSSAGRTQDFGGDVFPRGSASGRGEYVTGARAQEYPGGQGALDLAVFNEQVARARAVQALTQGQHSHPRGLPGAANMDPEKLAQWNAQLQFALAQQQAQQRHAQERQAQEWAHHAQAAQAALFTPPGSGHGAPSGGPTFDGTGDVFANFGRQPAFPTPFAYGLPALPGMPFAGALSPPPTTGTTVDMDDHAGSGTESTHGSPASSGHSDHVGHAHGHGHGHSNHLGSSHVGSTHGDHVGSSHIGNSHVGNAFGYSASPAQPRRPSLSMAHSTGHVPQQWSGGGSGQFAAMGILI